MLTAKIKKNIDRMGVLYWIFFPWGDSPIMRGHTYWYSGTINEARLLSNYTSFVVWHMKRFGELDREDREGIGKVLESNRDKDV